MYTTPRKPKSKDDTLQTPKKPTEDKFKRSLSNLATPRPYPQKTTTTDIYGQRKTANPSIHKAPKKTGTTTTTSNESPMKNQLKSSSTTTVINSARSGINRSDQKKVDSKILEIKTSKSQKNDSTNEIVKTRKKALLNESHKLKKNLPLTQNREKNIVNDKAKKNILTTNVTVNSPIVKKRAINVSQNNDKEYRNENVERQRTKTRTLDESEAKILTTDGIDNNVEMQNLARKLSAKPKAFYVDLEDDKSKIKKDKISEDEYSYEDDFESYESDFESYYSDKSSNNDGDTSAENLRSEDEEDNNGNDNEHGTVNYSLKENKDEEKMLDSGNFDLRDAQRSAQKTKPMDFIVERAEDSADKKPSLTDEGFQDMSSSSTASSMRIVHVDVLERPLLIDFSKSNKINRVKQDAMRRKQRTKDILNMITLHTMSYSLFELNPIPYDIYMATYGRVNYKQTEVQTFDDGITEEIQTEHIDTDDKWTQHPVKFSKNTINVKKYKRTNEILEKFSFLNKNEEESIADNENDDYKTNPLRIYLEQKDGVGSGEILPYAKYKSKLGHKVNMRQLKRFMKRVESRIISALSTSTDNGKAVDLNQKSSFPFSDSYVTLSTKENVDFKQYKIVNIVFSDSKSNLAMTVHKNISITKDKSIICLWDIGAKLETPMKTLIAVNEVSLAKYRGGADGIFVAALKDGSLHLWDLSERATYTEEEEDAGDQLQEVKQPELMSQMEIDREWNLRNSQVGYHKKPAPSHTLHSCAFTTSANSVNSSDTFDTITGLEVVEKRLNMENGGKIIGQICSLLRIGILTIWSIVHEKRTSKQLIGKAYWSRTRLEQNALINLTDFIEKPISDDMPKTFSLNAAKRRINRRKSERSLLNEFTRPKSAASFDSFDIDRPASAASRKSRNCAQIDNSNNWDSGLLCKDLKVMKIDGVDHYLIAKNCGEVLCLTRSMGVAKVEKLYVTTDTSSVTKLEVSPHGLPYFLAATECETLNLCSLVENRVLLSLDCRNDPSSSSSLTQDLEKYNTDSRGRFIGTVPLKHQPTPPNPPVTLDFQTTLKSVHWLPTNPCGIVTVSLDGVVSLWQLERSDICPSFTKQSQAVVCAHAQGNLAFVTQDGSVEVHRLTNKQNLTENLALFQKYVSLL